MCDNGLYCDGEETCDAVNDCQAGTAIVCDDGVSCTVDSCNEDADMCDYDPASCGCFSDADCDNGLFCDGLETCNLTTNTCV